MTDNDIQILARQVSYEVFDLKFYLTYGCLSLLSFTGAQYLGAYLNIKGKNLATREDFEDLKKQLEQNTRTVELVKTEISHADWREREKKVTKRQKLEELISTISEQTTYLEELRYSKINGSTEPKNNNLNEKIHMIATLYFEDLVDAVSIYINAARKFYIQLLKGYIRLNNLPSSHANNKERDELNKNLMDIYEQLYKQQKSISFVASRIMKQLL